MAFDKTVKVGEEITLHAVPEDVDKKEVKSAEPVTFSIRQGAGTLSNVTDTSVLFTPGKVEELVIVDAKVKSQKPGEVSVADSFFAIHVLSPAVALKLTTDEPVPAGSTAKIPAKPEAAKPATPAKL